MQQELEVNEESERNSPQPERMNAGCSSAFLLKSERLSSTHRQRKSSLASIRRLGSGPVRSRGGGRGHFDGRRGGETGGKLKGEGEGEGREGELVRRRFLGWLRCEVVRLKLLELERASRGVDG